MKFTSLVGMIVILTVVCIIVILLPKPKSDKDKAKETFINKDTSCSLDSCGAIAPVDDPAYNVKETIKNTLLVEQHLAEKDKYCKACLVKHQLISQGLLAEALQMAGDHPEKYPKLEESLQLHQRLFEVWHAHMDDDEVRLETLARYREWRREMVQLYYF